MLGQAVYLYGLGTSSVPGLLRAIGCVTLVSTREARQQCAGQNDLHLRAYMYLGVRVPTD